jgi:hypothetical protein
MTTKQYIVTKSKTGNATQKDTEYLSDPLTVVELVKYYLYTLETGAAYQSEKGNKKINCKPTTIKSLITNLNNAANNSSANGYAGVIYSSKEVTL